MARKTSAISVLQVEPQLVSRLRVAPGAGPLEVLGHDVQAGPGPAEEGALGTALKAFAEQHALAEDEIYTVLPRHHITTRIVDLPSHEPEEILSMVRLSAEEWVPFGADEILVDQVVLQKLPSGEARVLVAIAHRDAVQQHLALLREAGLEPRHIYLSTTCLMAAVSAAAGSVREERYGLVNLAAGGLEVLVFNKGRLEFVRGLATNHPWPTAEPGLGEAIEELAVEVRGSLATYRRESEDGEAVETVYLSGDGLDPQPYAEALLHETGKEVSTAGFARGLVGSGGEKLQGIPLASLGAALTAQGRAGQTIDLVPASVTRGREMAGLRQRLARVAGLAAAVVFSAGVLYAQAVYQRQSYLSEVQAQVRAIEDAALDVEEKERQLDILSEQVSRTGSLLEMLAAVATAAPEEGVNITRISFNREQGLDFWGLAKELDLVHQFAQSVRSQATNTLEFLRRARSLYEQQGMEHQEQVYHYQIEVPLQDDAEEVPAS